MEFRPKAREGLWLCFLLPIALMLTYINRTTNTHQSSYQTATILSWFLLIHSIYFALSKPLPSFQDLQIRKDFMKFSKSHLPAIMTMIVIVMIVILTMLGILGFILCIFGYMTFKIFFNVQELIFLWRRLFSPSKFGCVYSQVYPLRDS